MKEYKKYKKIPRPKCFCCRKNYSQCEARKTINRATRRKQKQKIKIIDLEE